MIQRLPTALRFLFLTSLFLLLGTSPASAALDEQIPSTPRTRSAPADPPTPLPFVPGELLIEYTLEAKNDNVIKEHIQHEFKRMGLRFNLHDDILRLNEDLTAGTDTRQLSIHSSFLFSLFRQHLHSTFQQKHLTEIQTNLRDQIKTIPGITHVQFNYQYYPRTNDPEYAKQWGLHNTGQTVNGSTGSHDKDIDMPEAWNVEDSFQQQVIVAVIDTGVDVSHPDLKNNMVAGWDFIDNDSTPHDLHGHGTRIAGIIAAQTGNSKGIAGMSSKNKIKVMPLRTDLTTSQIVDAIDYARNHGAKIINASWGSYGFGSAMDDQFLYEAIKRFRNAGGLFVVAAGNASLNQDSGNPSHRSFPNYYAVSSSFGEALSNIVNVASTNNKDQLSSFSDYGTKTIHVGAPGENIYSTFLHTIFEENFESVTPPDIGSQFTQDGDATWGTHDFGSTTVAYGDIAFPYQHNKNSYLVSPTFDVSTRTFTALNFTYNCTTESTPDTDFLALEVFYQATWHELDRYNGTSFSALEIVDMTAYRSDSFQFRFRWKANGSVTNDGCWVDNIKLRASHTTSDQQYTFSNGTSFSAPYAAGLAALIWSYNPSLSAGSVKTILFETGDRTSSLVNKISTQRRINAYNGLKASLFAPKGQAIAANVLTGELHIAAQDAEGFIKHTLRHSDGSWQNQGWGDVSAKFGNIKTTQNPAIAYDPARKRLHLVLIHPTTHHILHTYRNDDGSWQGHIGDVTTALSQTKSGVKLSNTAPAATVDARTGNLHVVIREKGTGRPWHTIRFADGNWQAQGWGDISNALGSNQKTHVGLAAAYDFENQTLQLLMVEQSTNRLLHTVRFANGNWQTQGWGDVTARLGGKQITSLQPAISYAPGIQQMHISMVNGANEILHSVRLKDGSWQNQGWGNVTKALGGNRKTHFSPSLSYDPRFNQLHVSMIYTTNNHLLHSRRFDNGSWQGQGWGDVTNVLSDY